MADRLALGFDPAIVHMFGVDPSASDTVPALLPPTEATVEQWLDAIAKHPHSWIIEHEGRLLGDVRLKANDSRNAPLWGLARPIVATPLKRQTCSVNMGHRGHRGIGTRPMESGQSRDPLGLCIERIMPPRKDPAVRLAGEGKSPISISFVNQLG